MAPQVIYKSRGNISTTKGAISLTVSSGALSTANGISMQATGGGINLTVAPSGSNIQIGQRTTLFLLAPAVLPIRDNNVTAGQISIGGLDLVACHPAPLLVWAR